MITRRKAAKKHNMAVYVSILSRLTTQVAGSIWISLLTYLSGLWSGEKHREPSGDWDGTGEKFFALPGSGHPLKTDERLWEVVAENARIIRGCHRNIPDITAPCIPGRCRG